MEHGGHLECGHLAGLSMQAGCNVHLLLVHQLVPFLHVLALFGPPVLKPDLDLKQRVYISLEDVASTTNIYMVIHLSFRKVQALSQFGFSADGDVPAVVKLLF